MTPPRTHAARLIIQQATSLTDIRRELAHIRLARRTHQPVLAHQALLCSIITDLEHYLLRQNYNPYALWTEDEQKVNSEDPLEGFDYLPTLPSPPSEEIALPNEYKPKRWPGIIANLTKTSSIAELRWYLTCFRTAKSRRFEEKEGMWWITKDIEELEWYLREKGLEWPQIWDEVEVETEEGWRCFDVVEPEEWVVPIATEEFDWEPMQLEEESEKPSWR